MASPVDTYILKLDDVNYLLSLTKIYQEQGHNMDKEIMFLVDLQEYLKSQISKYAMGVILSDYVRRGLVDVSVLNVELIRVIIEFITAVIMFTTLIIQIWWG